MSHQRWAAAVDEATIAALEATSWRSPRDFLRDCWYCSRPFWVHSDGHSAAHQRYCCPSHCQLWHYHVSADRRAAALKRQRAYDARTRGARRAARRAA